MMKPLLKKLAVPLLGWAFLLLGIAGLFLPVLQGVLFIAIGLTILSTEYAWAHRLLQKLRQRFPAVARYLDASKERISNLFRRHKSKGDPACRGGDPGEGV
jgi:uncharacterized membrane protein YbaN (DUF454 family)